MSIDMTVQPASWADAFQAPRMTAAEAYAARDAEVRQAQAAEDARHEHCGAFHHGSCEADMFMRKKIARLEADLARMTADRDRLHMLVHHKDIQPRSETPDDAA